MLCLFLGVFNETCKAMYLRVDVMCLFFVFSNETPRLRNLLC